MIEKLGEGETELVDVVGMLDHGFGTCVLRSEYETDVASADVCVWDEHYAVGCWEDSPESCETVCPDCPHFRDD